MEQAVFSLSTMASAFGWYAYETRPDGILSVGPGDVEVKESRVKGAGLGLFAARDLEGDTLLGTYPGCVWPSDQWLKWKGFLPQDLLLMPSERQRLQAERKSRAREYVWKLESGYIIDPTSMAGDIYDEVSPELAF